MVPAFIIVLVVIAIALHKEGQVVRQFLLCDLERGHLTSDEYQRLGSVFGRMGSSFNALTQNGVKGWRTRRRFHQMASELAFHRCRVARGWQPTSPSVRELEEAYLYALQGLGKEMNVR